MKSKLLEVLGCPDCFSPLALESITETAGEEIVNGTLLCANCKATYPIIRSIPRFVEPENYAASFGLQWNRFRVEQLDSATGYGSSQRRFFRETAWDPEWMRGKWLLEIGCGAGRFLEVVADHGSEVVGLDLSNAVDAAYETLKGKPGGHLVQASVYKMPFQKAALDGCYCIGVLQHTPEPARAAECMPAFVKPGGKLAITVYDRKWYTPLNGKYLIRPLTRRLPAKFLLRVIESSMKVLFPLTTFLFKLPRVGRVFRFFIPVANYVERKHYSRQQRYNLAVLDTFDMLSPRYDHPPSQRELSAALEKGGAHHIQRQPNAGLNLVASK